MDQPEHKVVTREEAADEIFGDDVAERAYFQLEMAWCEILDAMHTLEKQAIASKCPVDLHFFKEVTRLSEGICKLQKDIRAHDNNEYTGDNNANA
jgi:hypothetical protein